MSYIDQEQKLEKILSKLPQATQELFKDYSILFIIGDTGDGFNLTMGEIGEVCELVRQVITKERPVEKFEEGLKEKLADDEDNLAKAGEIVATINEKIFVKLLPALGLKALPILMTPAVAKNLPDVNVSFEEGKSKEDEESAVAQPLGSSQQSIDSQLPTPPRTVMLNKMPQTQAPTAPKPNRFPNLKSVAPVLNLKPFSGAPSPGLSKFSSAPSGSVGASANTSAAPIKPRTPLMETPTEMMSENQTESFLKMLAGKLDEKDLQSRFDKLPFALKTALRSMDSAKKVLDIGIKYGLHVDKLGVVAEETGLVILGMTHPNQFLPRLNRRLGIGEEKTRPIAQEINTEIFLKIREALKQVNGEEPSYANLAQSAVATKSIAPATEPEPHPYNPIDLAQTSEAQTENIAVQQEGGEILDREKILREIENPSTVKMTPVSVPVPKVESRPVEIKPQIPAPIVPPPAPPAQPPRQEFQFEPPAPKPQETPKPIVTSPTSNIVDQKLSDVTAAKKTGSSYSADPYREPLQ
ncbi:MAG: hypothetical protein V4467_02935 [Patescibacteria group bacterium]